MPQKERKQIRLMGYDYGEAGCYFVTLCTHNRQHLFKIELHNVGHGPCAVPHSPCNRIIRKGIEYTREKFPNMSIDHFVIMPDHLHFIVSIKCWQMGCSLPDIMRYFKAVTTNAFIRGVKSGMLAPFENKLWQKSYYDHVIRNQRDYNEIWEYIEYNPVKWKETH